MRKEPKAKILQENSFVQQ